MLFACCDFSQFFLHLESFSSSVLLQAAQRVENVMSVALEKATISLKVGG